MLEKSLNYGQIAASSGAVALAFADAVATGGLTTALVTGGGATISGGLATVAIAKDKQSKAAAQAIAKALEDHLIAKQHPEQTCADLADMLQQLPLTEDHIAEGNRTAATIAAQHRERFETLDTNADYKTPFLLGAFEDMLTAMLAPVENDPDKAGEKVILDRTQALTDQLQETGGFRRMIDEGITEKAIIRLARRIAENVDDLGAAWAELQNSVDVAVRVQQEGTARSNQGDFVDTVLHRVAELSADGQYEAAGAEIDAALEQEAAEHQARTARLMRSGLEQATLARDPDRAAALLIRRADSEASEFASFEDLIELRSNWQERGWKMGNLFDQDVAISLARSIVSRAPDQRSRGIALDHLGVALAQRGERNQSREMLDEAANALRQALKEFSPEGPTRHWAVSQANLGTVLMRLGEHETGNENLVAAIEAFRAALTKMKELGNQRDWAITRMSLSSVFLVMGQRGEGTSELVEAVQGYEEALNAISFEDDPGQWARIKLNLATALVRIGERDADVSSLEKAADHYLDALKVNTRDTLPIEWAMTVFNATLVDLAMFELDGNSGHLDKAKANATAAKGVIEKAGVENYLKLIDDRIDLIESRRDP